MKTYHGSNALAALAAAVAQEEEQSVVDEVRRNLVQRRKYQVKQQEIPRPRMGGKFCKIEATLDEEEVQRRVEQIKEFRAKKAARENSIEYKCSKLVDLAIRAMCTWS